MKMSENERPEIKVPCETHIICVLLLDTSGSMGGVGVDGMRPIDSLNRSVMEFQKEICKDEMAKRTIDVAIVKFDDTVEMVAPFTPVEDMEYSPQVAKGRTCMGTAIIKAIDLIKERVQAYNCLAVSYFSPLIIMVTKGESTDSIKEAIERVQEEKSKRRLLFITIAPPGANKETLLRIAPVIEHSDEAFDWLAFSLIHRSFWLHDPRRFDNEPLIIEYDSSLRTLEF